MHLLSWQDWSDEHWQKLVSRATALSHSGHQWEHRAADRSLGLVFFNPSLRTRTSMDLAASQLGAHVTVLEPGSGVWNMAWEDDAVMDGDAAEHIEEAFGVLSQYFDALGVRIFANMDGYAPNRDETLFRKIIDASDVPVINLESAFYHPCQALADAVTLTQKQPAARKFVLSWCYHPKALPMAVPNSTLLMAARQGYDVTVARPSGFELDSTVMSTAMQLAERSGGSLAETDNLTAACAGAHVVYAKAWAGKAAYENPDEEKQLRTSYQNWRVTADLIGKTNQACLMHPLPVRRNVVVDTAVLKSENAIHLAQARNRLFAQKAILEHIWKLH